MTAIKYKMVYDPKTQEVKKIDSTELLSYTNRGWINGRPPRMDTACRRYNRARENKPENRIEPEPVQSQAGIYAHNRADSYLKRFSWEDPNSTVRGLRYDGEILNAL